MPYFYSFISYFTVLLELNFPPPHGLRKQYSKKLSKMTEAAGYVSNLPPCILCNSGKPLKACICHHLGSFHERNTHATLVPNLHKL